MAPICWEIDLWMSKTHEPISSESSISFAISPTSHIDKICSSNSFTVEIFLRASRKSCANGSHLMNCSFMILSASLVSFVITALLPARLAFVH